MAHSLREAAAASSAADETAVPQLPPASKAALSHLGEQLLVHSVRLLAILHHVLEATAPASTPTPSTPSSSASKLQSAAAGLSPIKKKNAEPATTPVSPPPPLVAAASAPLAPSLERGLSLKAADAGRRVTQNFSLHILLIDCLERASFTIILH